eukprot:14842-Heterococcus_DN1.PRE.2
MQHTVASPVRFMLIVCVVYSVCALAVQVSDAIPLCSVVYRAHHSSRQWFAACEQAGSTQCVTRFMRRGS